MLVLIFDKGLLGDKEILIEDKESLISDKDHGSFGLSIVPTSERG